MPRLQSIDQPRPATTKQIEVLEFVKKIQAEKGYSPTVEEVAKQFDIVKSAAWARIQQLSRRGLLKQNPGVVRGLQAL